MTEKHEQIDPLIESVGRFIDANDLIAPGSFVLVGVSGGADSVALLAALRQLSKQPARKYRLTVAHLDHMLRDEASEDARWVAKLAGDWGIECIVEQRDVAARAKRLNESIEQAARDERYEFLAAVAERVGAAYVAVGHHLDDNIETILYRIFRGTHMRGLGGIAPSRPLAGGMLTLVRPLLGCRRSEIEDFCKRANLQWREDSTNADTSYRRNFIRHELLPLLQDKLNARADEAILRLASAAIQVDSFISEQAERVISSAIREEGDERIVLDAAALSSVSVVLQAAAIRTLLERLAVPMQMVGSQRLDELCRLLDGDGAVALPGGFEARRRHDEFIIAKTSKPSVAADQAVVLECPGKTSLSDGMEITCELEPFDESAFKEHCRKHPAGVELIDAEKVHLPLVCRQRAEGDTFVPLGAPGHQKVGNFLTNLKLPARRHEAVRCICDELGIVYVAPLRIDERIKVSESTRKVLKIAIV